MGATRGAGNDGAQEKKGAGALGGDYEPAQFRPGENELEQCWGAG
jgi:hypothetical protein